MQRCDIVHPDMVGKDTRQLAAAIWHKHALQGLTANATYGQANSIKLHETRYCCVKPTADHVGVQKAASEIDFLEHSLHSWGTACVLTQAHLHHRSASSNSL